ncbi:ornithine cyclodeaminase [Brachybacterium huguangmaarense]
MTDFVGVSALARWLRQCGTQQVIAEMTDRLEDDVRRWKDFEKQPRIASHSPVGVIELMPAADAERYGFKYVNGHPSNPARGFQTVTAFGALAEVHNGYPVLLSEMTLLTALRTAATSALAARHLARRDSRRAALIGTGCQAPFQALGLRAELGIEDLAIFDTDPVAMDTFTEHAEALGFRVCRAGSAAEAVADADVITTCTADKQRATVLARADIPRGAHINAIGGDCPGKTELDPGILDDAAGVFVEFTPQTRIEGEIQAKAPDFPVTELWEVVTGIAPGRTDAADLTVFDSVGFAIEDFSALSYLYEKLHGTEFVEDIDIIADPRDPKDLFSLVGAEAAVAAGR